MVCETSCFGCDQSVSVSLGGIKKFSWERRLVLSPKSVVVLILLILFSWSAHTFTVMDDFLCCLVSCGSLFLGAPAVEAC